MPRRHRPALDRAIQYSRASAMNRKALEYWIPAFAVMTVNNGVAWRTSAETQLRAGDPDEMPGAAARSAGPRPNLLHRKTGLANPPAGFPIPTPRHHPDPAPPTHRGGSRAAAPS